MEWRWLGFKCEDDDDSEDDFEGFHGFDMFLEFVPFSSKKNSSRPSCSGPFAFGGVDFGIGGIKAVQFGL